MSHLNSLCFPCGRLATLTTTTRRYQHKQTITLKCSFSPSTARHSRRLASVTLLLLHCLYLPTEAVAGTVLDKYMRRRRLDPLESYIPPVILAQFQIQELGEILEADKPSYAACRNLLRAGPASSLRINIRAVAEYASDRGAGKSAAADVDQCLSALEDLDSQLLRATRNESDVSVESMKSKISAAVNALNSLLNTVPADTLNKGKVIANAYQTQDEVASDNQDPELKKLESLL